MPCFLFYFFSHYWDRGRHFAEIDLYGGSDVSTFVSRLGDFAVPEPEVQLLFWTTSPLSMMASHSSLQGLYLH